jgi:HK97 family phage major capsid protein
MRSNPPTTGGFRDLGEFMGAVVTAGKRGGVADPRLHITGQAPTTYGNQSTGVDGGYLVPTDFAQQIYLQSLAEGSFLALTDELPVTGGGIELPRDDGTPWGSTGLQVRWQGEATDLTQSKPKLSSGTMKLRKVHGFVPMTDELMADARAGGVYTRKRFGEALAWAVNLAIVEGNGGDRPLGFRRSDAIITVSKETSQTADTINATNVAKMFGRLLPASHRSTAVRWLVHHDALPQLFTLNIDGRALWTEPGAAFEEAPSGFLLGRPLIVSQAAQVVGDLGDIALVDFKQYVTISKGPEFAESLHVYFDKDMSAIRLVFRVDGQPWLKAPVSPYTGASSYSPFVQLEAR